MVNIRRVSTEEAALAKMPSVVGFCRVHDVIMLCTCQTRDAVRKTWSQMKDAYTTSTSLLKFRGQGCRETPIASPDTSISIFMATPGRVAKQIRADHKDTVINIIKGTVKDNDNDVNEFTSIWKATVAPKKKPGMLYAVTSPLVNLVKVGRWSGTLNTLKGRCTLVYGPDITLEHVLCNDTVFGEAVMLSSMKKHVISGELFPKTSWNNALFALERAAAMCVG